MIIIVAPDAEQTVNTVIYWLNNLKISFFRMDDIKENFDVNIDSFEICKSKISLKKEYIISFWNRKGNFRINTMYSQNYGKTKQYLFRESSIVSNFFIQQLEEKKYLGNYFLQIPNKLSHLYLAQKSGLEIPKTTITNHKNAIKSFNKDSLNIINKSLSDSFTGTFNQTYYYNHTERVSNEIVEELENSFFPSLFQEELQKAYELRIVFVQETLWSMAIFSQNDTKTQVDWRNYNHERPNRKVPFKLPFDVEKNIRKFIKASGLNTGAIDMVVTKDKKYVFLECNPNGQIGMVSEHCNYFIEKYIADYLTTP
jgi:ATP-GRASP peptide maturase of grasp-with-spasm system